MEIETWLFAVLLAGAGLVAALLTALVLRVLLKRRNADLRRAAEKLQRAEAVLHDAEVAARRDAKRIAELEAEVGGLSGERDAAAAELEQGRDELRRRLAQVTASERRYRTFERRFSDVAGLESEVATLRVIAGRVPELEREVADLKAQLTAREPSGSSDRGPCGGPGVIDLTDDAHQRAE